MDDERTELQRLTAALQGIDSATTQAGQAQTAIGARIQGFLDKIQASDNAAEMKSLADQASAEVARLQPIADALSALATDPTNPVPIPIPVVDPGPAQPADPQVESAKVP